MTVSAPHQSHKGHRAYLLAWVGLIVALILAGCTASGGGGEQPLAEAHRTLESAESSLSVEEEAAAVDDALALADSFDISMVPAYDGFPSVRINGNVPFFTAEALATAEGRYFTPLDSLGRCGSVWMVVSPETLATEARGSIGMVKPSGWHTVRYDWVDGQYLYNRCHLLGYQLSGENANVLNLITGTRSMNVAGMQPWENSIDSYVERTGDSVLLRVTPVFEGNNLVASGVLMEAQSLGDPSGLSFCVWCYNVEPGVEIDYATGESRASTDGVLAIGGIVGNGEAVDAGSGSSADEVNYSYVLNTNTHKFHRPDCKSVLQMKDKNREYSASSRDELISRGYSPCGVCHP